MEHKETCEVPGKSPFFCLRADSIKQLLRRSIERMTQSSSRGTYVRTMISQLALASSIPRAVKKRMDNGCSIKIHRRKNQNSRFISEPRILFVQIYLLASPLLSFRHIDLHWKRTMKLKPAMEHDFVFRHVDLSQT